MWSRGKRSLRNVGTYSLHSTESLPRKPPCHENFNPYTMIVRLSAEIRVNISFNVYKLSFYKPVDHIFRRASQLVLSRTQFVRAPLNGLAPFSQRVKERAGGSN
jgi:hypothetical protein